MRAVGGILTLVAGLILLASCVIVFVRRPRRAAAETVLDGVVAIVANWGMPVLLLAVALVIAGIAILLANL